MINYFVFGDVDSRDYNAYVFRKNTYAAPVQEYTVQPISGKNGSLLMANNRFPDVAMTLSVIIPDDSGNMCSQLLNALLSLAGYQRLDYSEDTYVYYIAYLQDQIIPEVTSDRGISKFDLFFTRKPQKFLAGDFTEIHTESPVNFRITNPTRFSAAPLLRVYGTGTLYIGDEAITITECDGYTDIDCEIMEAYKDSAAYPKSQYIQLSGYDYPKLKPGVNAIMSDDNSITNVTIIPRWWQL